jgi:opacity protein-like surface antigen
VRKDGGIWPSFLGPFFAFATVACLWKGIVMRMRIAAALAVVSVAIFPAGASAQTSLDGFGALPLDHVTSFGDSGVPVDFGGRVSFEVVRGVEVLGEFGRLGNVLPGVVALPLSFSRLDLRVSAFYGEGGVRLLAAPRSAVSPYAEATAGVAHLRFGATGLGSTTDAIVRAALNLVDTRDPMFGAGGGVLMRAGPLHVDVGYRYKRIMANSMLSSVIGIGQDLQSHQVRFGAGVRF